MVIRDLLDKVLINQRLVIIDLNQSATKANKHNGKKQMWCPTCL